MPLGYRDTKRWVQARVNDKPPGGAPNKFFSVPNTRQVKEGLRRHQEASPSRGGGYPKRAKLSYLYTK